MLRALSRPRRISSPANPRPSRVRRVPFRAELAAMYVFCAAVIVAISFAYQPLTTVCCGAPLVSPLLISFLTLAELSSDFQSEGLPASTAAGPVPSHVKMNKNAKTAPRTMRASWIGPAAAVNLLIRPFPLLTFTCGADSGTGGTAGPL